MKKPLTLVASHLTVRVLDGDDEVARHDRCWDRKRQIECETHLSALADEKRKARAHRGRNRLSAMCPGAIAFLEGVALHGGHLGGTTARLLHLLDQYGPDSLDGALREAHTCGAFTAQSVAHILDQRRRAQGAPVPLEPVLPDDPRLRNLVVVPHRLDSYDRLGGTDVEGQS